MGFKKHIISFRNALRGGGTVLASQVNFRIQLLILAVVAGAGVLLKISPAEWVAVVLASGLVLTAECLNTAIEILGDVISREDNPALGKAKDAAAAGVLIAAVAAAVTGLVVFLPYLLKLLR